MSISTFAQSVIAHGGKHNSRSDDVLQVNSIYLASELYCLYVPPYILPSLIM